MGTDVTVGEKRHQSLNQPKFAEKWGDALAHQPADRRPERARLASDRRSAPHVLVADHRVPMPDRDSGSLRMWHLLEGLLELGCAVTFLPDDREPHEPYTTQLQGMGIEVLYGSVWVPQHLAALSPRLKLCILSRPYVAARYVHMVREHAPEALLAYDTVDLHFLRESRRALSAGGDPRLADTFRPLELALTQIADVTLAVSEDERERLRELVPDATVEVMPNANRIARDVPGPEGRHGLVFIGSFEHTPNVDAALLLAREVMPRVWAEVEDMTLTIVGGDAPEEVTELDAPRIDVAGWVKDIGPLLRQSLAMAAPLSYGAGMKGKVTQSLAAGLPVITTTVGSEGLDVEDGRELLIADDPYEFAKRIVGLSRDPDLWRRLSADGQALVERVCSPAVQLSALRVLLEMGEARQSVASTASSAGRA
jgi:glycosyltransferase involved in cell wall biosynthesis